MTRGIVLAVATVAVVVGIWFLREETMSVHVATPPGSRTEVVVEAATRNAESSTSERELTEAMVFMCHLEVNAELGDEGILEVAPHTYGFALTPALDRSDRLQLQGCLQDFAIDHVLLEVVSFRHHLPGEAAAPARTVTSAASALRLAAGTRVDSPPRGALGS